jgi:acetylornithine deacetylase/succinyl-diaminopimelate desuccinylase-like protein
MAGDPEVIRILRDLIRFDTSNPPGNERPAAEYLATLLRRDGIDAIVLESRPGRGNVVARLAGDGSAPPLLLSAHLDVVPAVASEWTHPPFGAEIHDGYVWGRGAVDMKHMAAMSVVTLLELKRRGTRLRRDVIFAGVADEEAGGRAGAGWLVDTHLDRVKAAFCLTEVGGMSVPMPRATLIPIQVAEKGLLWFRLRVRGTAGHGSMPTPDSAVLKLCRAVTRLARAPLGYHLTPTAREFLRAVAAAQRAPASQLLRGLLSRPTARAMLRLVPPARRRAFRAMLYNTAAPTVLRAGVRVNVIPGEAVAEVDGRYLPGVTYTEFLEEVRRVVGPAFTIETIEHAPPVEMQLDSPVLDAIRQVMARHLPAARVVPYLLPGVTDAKHYARVGIPTYGFAPVELGPNEPFAELYHSPNERISVKGVLAGQIWLREVVDALAAA